MKESYFEIRENGDDDNAKKENNQKNSISFDNSDSSHSASTAKYNGAGGNGSNK